MIPGGGGVPQRHYFQRPNKSEGLQPCRPGLALLARLPDRPPAWFFPPYKYLLCCWTKPWAARYQPSKTETSLRGKAFIWDQRIAIQGAQIQVETQMVSHLQVKSKGFLWEKEGDNYVKRGGKKKKISMSINKLSCPWLYITDYWSYLKMKSPSSSVLWWRCPFLC